MSKWDIFLGVCAFIILSCFMVPRAFDLQAFTQWGGMYTDGWCSVNVYGENLSLANQKGIEKLTTERILAGEPSVWRLVWYPPMHTSQTCVAWAHSYCGKTTFSGMKIQSAFVTFRRAFLAEAKNICQLPDSSSFQWFHHS